MVQVAAPKENRERPPATPEQTNKKARQQEIAELLSTAQKALSDAEANLAMAMAIAGPNSSLATKLKAQLERARTNYNTILDVANGRTALIDFAALRNDINTTAAEVSQSTGTVVILAILEIDGSMEDKALLVRLAETEWKRAQLRAQAITERNIEKYAESYFRDPDMTRGLRTAMTKHFVRYLRTPEGDEYLTIHNATPSAVRVAVAVAVEQQESLFIQALKILEQKKIHPELVLLMQEHKLRQTVAIELIPNYLAIINGTHSSQDIAIITQQLNSHATHQDQFMEKTVPRLAAELHIDPAILNVGDSSKFWASVKSVYRDPDPERKKNAFAAWETMEKIDGPSQTWGGIKQELKSKGFSDQAIEDAAILRVAKLANVEYTFQVITKYEMARAAGKLQGADLERIKILEDQSRPAKERAEAFLSELTEAANWYKDIPRKARVRMLTEAIEQADAFGGFQKLANASAVEVQKVVQRTAAEIALDRRNEKKHPAIAQGYALRDEGVVMANDASSDSFSLAAAKDMLLGLQGGHPSSDSPFAIASTFPTRVAAIPHARPLG